MTAAKKTAAAKKAPRKTAAKKSIVPQNPAPSMSMVRIGGHDYPMVTVPTCRTCQSPHRREIEREILLGRTYSSIARRIAEMEEGHLPHPSADAMSAHVQGNHLPTPMTVRRRIVDRRAAALGDSIEKEESLVDHVIVNEMILQRGWERLMSGEIEPSMNDLLSAVANQAKIEATSQEGYTAEAYQSTLMAYLEVAQRFIPPEMLSQYGRELKRHPVIRAVLAKDRETVAGEVLDERED